MRSPPPSPQSCVQTLICRFYRLHEESGEEDDDLHEGFDVGVEKSAPEGHVSHDKTVGRRRDCQVLSSCFGASKDLKNCRYTHPRVGPSLNVAVWFSCGCNVDTGPVHDNAESLKYLHYDHQEVLREAKGCDRRQEKVRTTFVIIFI